MSAWSNHCGSLARNPDPDEEDRARPIQVISLIAPVKLRSDSALNKFRNFSKDWVLATWKVSVEDHHSTWAHNPWKYTKEELPGKVFGQPISESVLKETEIRLEHQLRLVYELLQPYVAYLRATAEDRNRQHDEEKRIWAHGFLQMAEEIQGVLCELRSALWELDHIPVNGDIIQVVMDPEIPIKSRNLQDWFALRDSTNALEYLSQICETLEKDEKAAIVSRQNE